MSAVKVEVKQDPADKPDGLFQLEKYKFIEGYDRLSEQQARLFACFAEFCDTLRFECLEESSVAFRSLRILVSLTSKSTDDLFFVVINYLLTRSTDDIKNTMRYYAMFPGAVAGSDINSSSCAPNLVAYTLLMCLVYRIRHFSRENEQRMSETCRALMKYLPLKSYEISAVYSAKLFRTIVRIYYLGSRFEEVRPFVFHMLNVHELIHYEESYASLVNIIFDNYSRKELWIQASNFLGKIKFPTSASNNEQARFLYYSGFVSLVHRDYKTSLDKFQGALTKSPGRAIGFKQSVVRCIILVKLLMGEYPDRKLFINEFYFKGIIPYFGLIKAIKIGSPRVFVQYLLENLEQFEKDRTAKIVLRLHHNVLKSALKKISLSYSCISLKDISRKLQLENPSDVEYIVSKAIKDNVVSAEIDHSDGYVSFIKTDNAYDTNKPQKMLQQRVEQCVSLYTKFVTSMSYPKVAYNFETKYDPDRADSENADLDYFLRTFDDDLL